ncbi:protein trichome birefringence-like 4 [Coffea eugenioides]|uniref:Protein trichome birefringence-like 4 n=1 Tax=Coffea arabica TaxID=13443 RepID=A0A6P6X4P4_COFAR|nr:protein trichome birefringence-like 4 [Coffea arabica]XP_027164752.1 protein trichome birefringence-like 4 [Coffea eugenioides]
MDSFKNLFFDFSRNFGQSLPKSRTKGLFTLFLTLVLAIIFFSPLSNKSPAVTSKNLVSHLHPGSNYISSLSSIVPSEPHFISQPPRTCTDAVTFSAVNKSNETSRMHESVATHENIISSCDIFDGNWILDDSEPLYRPGSCPFIDDAFNCFKNGRPDSDYLRLRWKPHGCEIPRFDGLKMLKMLSGKRLVFVGDSLNRNMWESLVCALRGSLGNTSNVYEVSGRREFRTEGFYSFKFQDFNLSVDFIKSPFLVQEWKLTTKAGMRRETLRLDMIQASSTKYHDADIIIFNTGHWWTHHKTSKGNNYFQEGNRVYNTLGVTDAFTKALKTWARWVDSNINSSQTTVFFRGYSASHFKGGQWNSGGSCEGETVPITNDTYLSPHPWMMTILESVISEMKTPVFLLNITKMTDYRKDGHPSIFSQPETIRRPGMIQDCSHWCLPGIPDSWNELLYVSLLASRNKFS